jgi:hypothetical protein
LSQPLRYGRIMINADTVNARVSIFCQRLFAHLLPFFARIPLFQNPFKYICSFQINHNTALAPVRQPCRLAIFIRKINAIPPLKIPLRRMAYNGAVKGDARDSRLSAQTSKR